MNFSHERRRPLTNRHVVSRLKDIVFWSTRKVEEDAISRRRPIRFRYRYRWLS